MRSGDPDQRLAELRHAVDQVSASLVELEIDSGRQLLDASALEGDTSARWTDAGATLAELWRRHGLLDVLLQQAEELRGAKRAERLLELLDGRSVDLTGGDVPLAHRTLLGGADETQRCTPRQLLAAMSDQFESVKATLLEISAAWERLLPPLDEARRRLQEARRQATELGEAQLELDAIGAQLDAAAHRVSSDPLDARADELDDIGRRLRTVDDELTRSAELKRGFERSMLGAHEELERLRALREEAAAAREELLVKIASPEPPAASAARDDLADELDAITELARMGAWRRARQALDDVDTRIVGALQDARRSRDAFRAPLQARNQLRALLETYQVKATRLGRREDPALAQLFGDAQDVLYTAPTDLARAAQLVRRYQLALSEPRSIPGATS